MKTTSKALYLSHGGGPLPLLGDAQHKELVRCLQKIAEKIPKPGAILVVSAHWEEPLPVITAAANPALIYDYYGFPEESYRFQYPCPGMPELANNISDALENTGISTKLDENRGFDHGLFVPLKIMYPQADIPCVQLSLVNTLDPLEHINIGRALRNLEYDNLLLIGSGSSFHNMQAFFAPETRESRAQNESFENWLADTCSSQSIDEKERSTRLAQWLEAPSARYCHPREEHLLPLHVCYGYSGTACSEHFELEILKRKASMYLWSAPC